MSHLVRKEHLGQTNFHAFYKHLLSGYKGPENSHTVLSLKPFTVMPTRIYLCYCPVLLTSRICFYSSLPVKRNRILTSLEIFSTSHYY
ncbi:unnamed protein product [Gulo gulo]|uniref:Uncharacterized protein n=1 Tax=Gulo gulo TaxID=48420 RepID=A0A9X9LNI3_GULGU|nr:unnamed protein product [Gulo gulo]